MLLSRIIALCLCGFVLSGCGATLSEKSPAYAMLGQVTVSTDGTRQGQVFRQEMERLLSRHDAAGKRYALSASITASYPDDAVNMNVALRLYDQQTGNDVLSKSIVSSASVGGVASLYGSEAAKNNALERLAINSAQKAYRYLMLHFTQQAATAQ